MERRPMLKDLKSLKVGLTRAQVGPAVPLVAREPAKESFPVDEAMPPVALWDEEVDHQLLPTVEPGGAGATDSVRVTPAHSLGLSQVAELTAADRIEAVCAQLAPEVRDFVENELRGRWVAVQVASAGG